MSGKQTVINNKPVGTLALAGLRVLEIGDGSALAYAGKLFADFGAEVIKVEDEAGDMLRSVPPLLETTGRQRQSALNAWLNTNKRNVTLRGGRFEEHAWLSRLAKTCDVVLDSRALSEGIDALSRPAYGLNEGTDGDSVPIEVCLTWFGENGPYSKFVGSTAVCRALAGAVYGSGAVAGPPHLPHDIQTGIVAGLAAFSSAISALIGESDGSRRYVLSIHEIAFSVVEMEAGMVQDGRHPKARLGVNRFCTTHPGGIYQTKKGWLGIFAHTAPQWAALCSAIGHPEHADDPRFVNGATRITHADEIDAFLAPALLTKTASEWFEQLGHTKFPAVLVPTMEELLQQRVHRQRGAFVPVQSGGTTFEGVVVPFPLGDAGPLPGGEAPAIGADNSFYRTDGALAAKVRRTRAEKAIPPLRTIRVIDLTMGWAGPLAARTLADFGAEVIKVEGMQYPDWWRGTHYNEAFYRERLYEKNANFALMNRNKLGITLDLTHQDGRKALLDLVKTADIVIENYSTEVLPKLGLSYDVLSKVNDRLVMVSMPAFGAGNEWSATRAYGGTLEQASGLPHYTGFPQNPPSLTSYAYGDPIGGWNGGAAALISLLVQARTGKGRHVNLSQVECMLPMAAPFLVEQSVCGYVTPRNGNVHPVFAPHSVYPCKGRDEWVVVSIINDAQWKALVKVLGIPDLDKDISLDQIADRRSQQRKIDAYISKWTRRRSSDEAMCELQMAGISAGVVKPVWHVLDDPHFQSRGFFKKIPRAYLGEYLTTTPWFRETAEPMEVVRPAPTLGEHSREVFSRVLGLTQTQQQLLEEHRITGTSAIKRST